MKFPLNKYVSLLILLAFILASSAEDLHNYLYHHRTIDVEHTAESNSVITNYSRHRNQFHQSCPLHNSGIHVPTLFLSHSNYHMESPGSQAFRLLRKHTNIKPFHGFHRSRAPPVLS